MKKIYLIGLIGVLFASCSNFLKEYSQDQAYVRSYKDLDELLIGATYMKTAFGNEAEAYYPYVHLMADETQENIEDDSYGTDFYGFQKKYFGYVTWQYRVGYSPDKLTTADEDKDWNKLYEHINLANMILDEIDKQDAENDDDRQAIARIRGEAYFLRAAYYFTLVNLYGQPYQPSTAAMALGVPVKTSPVIEDKMFPRETVAAVYALILEDLEQAAENLKGIKQKSVYRANEAAARLLQSRAYLYMQDWEEAARCAQLCLDLQKDLIDLNTFDGNSKAFAEADSPEVIFSMGGNNMPQLINTMYRGLSVSEGLKSCYQEEDLRSQYFMAEDEDAWVGYYWNCIKYVRSGESNSADVSDNFLFRTAEAWLNLAEASACLGGSHEAKAIEALDQLRKNRIETRAFEATDLSGDALIEEIRVERRRELCFEGHRWFDLRRYTVCEKSPFTGSIYNTYTEYDSYDPLSTATYELKAGDPSWTLQIPFEVIQFEGLATNPRNERAPISTEIY